MVVFDTKRVAFAQRNDYLGLTRQVPSDHARLVAAAREDAMQRSDRHHTLQLSA
jgi:hypothetical protein